jgi:hypothetical protein
MGKIMTSDAPPSADKDARAFDPGMTSVVIQAFDEAWKSLEETNSEFAQPSRAATTREVLARRVIEMARRGETNLDRLRVGALDHLRQHAKTVTLVTEADTSHDLPSSETCNRKAQEYLRLMDHAITAVERQHLIKLTSYWLDLAQKSILRREGESQNGTG